MDLLWLVIIVLFVMWLLGFGFKVGGNLVHILLVVALVVLLVRLLT